MELLALAFYASYLTLAVFVALELQVRVVEEPYLLRTQGPEYASYALRVGRFLPGAGRLRTRCEITGRRGAVAASR